MGEGGEPGGKSSSNRLFVPPAVHGKEANQKKGKKKGRGGWLGKVQRKAHKSPLDKGDLKIATAPGREEKKGRREASGDPLGKKQTVVPSCNEANSARDGTPTKVEEGNWLRGETRREGMRVRGGCWSSMNCTFIHNIPNGHIKKKKKGRGDR